MILSLVRLMRPQQWVKNGLCLAGVIFGGRLQEAASWEAAGATLVLFCLASVSVYVWNDINDRDRDRLHPKKCRRPIASGAVPVRAAAVLAAVLAVASLAGGYYLGLPTLTCLVLYMATNVVYCTWLKYSALFDVLCIQIGFVLRLLAGIYVLGDLPTTWIILCTFFLAGFLGFSKRRAELNSLGVEAEKEPAELHQRPVLRKYTVEFLDFLVSGSAIMTVISYALFTTSSGKNPTLIFTLPIVYYAIMHYQRLVMISEIGQEPDQILLRDGRLIFCIVAWLILFMGIWLGQIHIVR